MASTRELVAAGELPRAPLSWSELGRWLAKNYQLREALAAARARLVVHLGDRGVAILDHSDEDTGRNPLIRAWAEVLPSDTPPWQFTTVPGHARVWIGAICRTLATRAPDAVTAGDWHNVAVDGLIDSRLHATFGLQLVDGVLEHPSWLIRGHRNRAKKLLEKRIITPDARFDEEAVIEAVAQRLRGESKTWPWFAAKFGGAEVLDRDDDIASIVAMKQAVLLYLKSQATRPKPLNLVVLGAPGSGKSFLVNQLIRDLARKEKLEPRVETVNLTQIDGAEDIEPYFERLRTAAIQRQLGVLFVDEFDTERGGVPFGWVHYFLSPMQDGTYSAADGPRPLGRCILVFAGGVRATMQEVRAEAESDQGKKAKLLDFISRIHASHQVRGFEPTSDEGNRIQAAMLIHAYFRNYWPNASAVDIQLLEDLMRSGYAHGARSLEAVIANLNAHGAAIIGLDALPARESLSIHLRSGRLLNRL